MFQYLKLVVTHQYLVPCFVPLFVILENPGGKLFISVSKSVLAASLAFGSDRLPCYMRVERGLGITPRVSIGHASRLAGLEQPLAYRLIASRFMSVCGSAIVKCSQGTLLGQQCAGSMIWPDCIMPAAIPFARVPPLETLVA